MSHNNNGMMMIMMVDCDNDDTGDGNNIYGDGLM